jgi:DNA-binding GntR family transcriptional regulator
VSEGRLMREDGTLDRRTLMERAYLRLRHEVEVGLLVPGQRLDERALSERLGVSRTPLRHALEQLVHDGLAQRSPYQGIFVRSFTATDVENLYTVRSALEQLAVRLAVERASAEDLAQVRDLANRCCECGDQGDTAGLGEADRRFHEAIVTASQNDILIGVLKTLRRQVQAVRSFANEGVDLVKRTLDERLLICDAMEARDAEMAAKLLAAHIDDVRESAVTALRTGRDAGVTRQHNKTTTTRED